MVGHLATTQTHARPRLISSRPPNASIHCAIVILIISIDLTGFAFLRPACFFIAILITKLSLPGREKLSKRDDVVVDQMRSNYTARVKNHIIYLDVTIVYLITFSTFWKCKMWIVD